MELKNKETMNTINDTICAISTPHGSGGIAVARVSGPAAIQITEKIWRGKKLEDVTSHTAHLGEVLDSSGEILDQAVVTVFKAPSSYTSEDTVEISVHGSRWIQRELINSLINAGARLAERGEFTSRAFAAGRFDLAEAEAVADLIASSSRAAHRIAINQMRGSVSRRLDTLRQSLIELASLLELELDFSEEDVEFASRERLLQLASETRTEIERLVQSFNTGAAIKDGIPVAIIGKTNAGKSSLLNALLGDDRAIVSDIHGTTRDIVEDTIEIGDYLVRFQDTAGLRSTDDAIERIGIDRSYKAANSASIIIHVIDSTDNSSSAERLDDFDSERIITVFNKSDLTTVAIPQDAISISAKTGAGIDTLRNTLLARIDRFADRENGEVMLTNARHAQALSQASKSITDFIAALEAQIPTDLAAQLLRETLHHLSTVTGSITTPDILQSIFTKFCIGK